MGNDLRIEKIGYNGKLLELNGKVSPDLFRLAARKAPELKAWKHDQDKLSHTKSAAGTQNLSLVENALTALCAAAELQSEEL